MTTNMTCGGDEGEGAVVVVRGAIVVDDAGGGDVVDGGDVDAGDVDDGDVDDGDVDDGDVDDGGVEGAPPNAESKAASAFGKLPSVMLLS
jgi:hypothetical protein